mgnify:CR=1 FL=1
MTEVIDIKNVFDHSKACSQKDFSIIQGVSEKTISLLISKGVLYVGQSLGDWILRYSSHLREQAAGRATNGELDLATERAGLAMQQKLRIEMQNAITRREYAPIQAMEIGLSDLMVKLAAKFDTIIGKVKVRSDKLTADDLEVIGSVLAEVRNNVADMDIDWFGDADLDVDELEA